MVTVAFPAELNVPREFRGALDAFREPSKVVRSRDRDFRNQSEWLGHEPRYRVTVKWGRSLEPRIAAVSRTP